MSSVNLFCCREMIYNTQETKILQYNDVFDEYGILFSEDNISYCLLNYCPWCGKKLPKSKREEWFQHLETMGFDNPLFDENIPDLYKTAQWRQPTG